VRGWNRWPGNYWFQPAPEILAMEPPRVIAQFLDLFFHGQAVAYEVIVVWVAFVGASPALAGLEGSWERAVRPNPGTARG
jgi:hypothetical protein